MSATIKHNRTNKLHFWHLADISKEVYLPHDHDSVPIATMKSV